MKKTLLILAITAFVVATVPAIAQEDTKADTTASVQLTEKDWKAVEGTFVSLQKADMKVQFTASNGILVAKLMWNTAEVHLVPSSPLAFVSKEKEHDEPIRLHFHRDSTGIVNQVEVGGNGTWIREKNPVAEVPKKTMAHTPEQLKPFAGIYQAQFNQSLFLRLTTRDNFLWLKQLWDDVDLSFAPDTQLSFYAPAIPRFTLDFEKDEKGNIVRMLAFKRDVWLRTPVPHYTAEQLLNLSGRYISKNDPDNAIRLTVQGTHLVLIQLWDKKQVDLTPLAENYFYNESQSYPLIVLKDDKGNITGLQVLTTNFFIRARE